jgi:hypothetical protein
LKEPLKTATVTSPSEKPDQVQLTYGVFAPHRYAGQRLADGPAAVWRGRRTGTGHALAIDLLPAQADLDLPLDVPPLLGLTQSCEQLVERRLVGFSELEPCQKIERLSELAAMVEAARDGGEVLRPYLDVVRTRLEDCAPLVLREVPPGVRLPDGD